MGYSDDNPVLDFSPRMIKLAKPKALIPHNDDEEYPIPESGKNSILQPSQENDSLQNNLIDSFCK